MPYTHYHDIFIPFTDIYKLGGAEVFKHLERKKDDHKNLVVIPYEFIRNLDEEKDRGYSGGSEDVLKFLQNETNNLLYSMDLPNSGRINVYGVLEGLDVAIVDPRKDHKDFSVTTLEEILRKNLVPDENYHPLLITNREKYHIKYKGRGMRVESPKFLQVSADIVNEGIVSGSDELLAALMQEPSRVLPLEEALPLLDREELYVNQFVRFAGTRKSEYARVTADFMRNASGSRIVKVQNERLELLDPREHAKKMHVGQHVMDDILGIRPRDMEQYLAMQYGLLNPDVSLFFLCGSQGSGKTLLGYVAAVDLVLVYDKEYRAKRGFADGEGKNGFFKQIVLLKTNEILGGRRRDVGYLPGTLYEKLKPHLAPYIDAHKESLLGSLFPFEQMLMHPRFKNDFGEGRSEEAKRKINGMAYLPGHIEPVEMTYSGYMRGRSFRDTLVVMDEAQNLTPYEVKTVIERLGEGCKCVIMGDPAQVDNPDCSREINGLTHAIQRYLDKPYSALITLSKNYRSQMSDDAGAWKVYSS